MWRLAVSDTVILRSVPVGLDSDVGHQFVVDCTRAGEGIISDKELMEKYELSPVDWVAITKDVGLGRAIRAERERRVHNGMAAKEAAAKAYVKAPSILDRIMTDDSVSPRHRIESARELRQVAAAGAESAAAADRFQIIIDLSADGTSHVERYDKSIKVDARDGEDITPTNLISGGKPDADAW
jgi:hypothetical protein